MDTQYHSPQNGQALCKPCHTLKTRAKQPKAEPANKPEPTVHEVVYPSLGVNIGDLG
jgi:hypothetical protein